LKKRTPTFTANPAGGRHSHGQAPWKRETELTPLGGRRDPFRAPVRGESGKRDRILAVDKKEEARTAQKAEDIGPGESTKEIT